MPNATEDSVTTAYDLKDYLPVCYGKPYPLLCCGDVLSSDKNQNDDTPNRTKLKFDGLIEAPPEFQKEHLFHEVRELS